MNDETITTIDAKFSHKLFVILRDGRPETKGLLMKIIDEFYKGVELYKAVGD